MQIGTCDFKNTFAITFEVKNTYVVIPAKAGIQTNSNIPNKKLRELKKAISNVLCVPRKAF